MSAALNGITLNNFIKCVKVCEERNKTNPGIVVARELNFPALKTAAQQLILDVSCAADGT